jgi:hypothetical protein
MKLGSMGHVIMVVQRSLNQDLNATFRVSREAL